MNSRPVSSPASLGAAFLALLLAALLLLAVYVPVAQRGSVLDSSEGRFITANGLQVAYGGGHMSGQELVIDRYTRQQGDKRAIVYWRGRIQAEKFQRLSVDLEASHPGTAYQFFWRPGDNPEALRTAALTPAANATLSLRELPQWRGEIAELGLMLVADPNERRVAVRSIALLPEGGRELLKGHLQDWLAHRGWSQTSINQLHGSVDGRGLSPVPVAAAWVLLSIAILLGYFALSRRWRWGALLLVVIVPWLLLDLLWQRQLQGQLAVTDALFGGKSRHQQHLVDFDSAVYRYALELRELLPEEPVKLLILKEVLAHDFERLKLQFYLLPHNIYNFGMVPPEENLAPFDYILVLGDSPRMSFNEATGELRWGGDKAAPVEQVRSDGRGQLYRVLDAVTAGAERS